MAVKNNASTKLVLKVKTGTDEKGKALYSQRTFQHISPELSTDEAYALGAALGNLQKYPVESVARTDSAVLTEA